MYFQFIFLTDVLWLKYYVHSLRCPCSANLGRKSRTSSSSSSRQYRHVPRFTNSGSVMDSSHYVMGTSNHSRYVYGGGYCSSKWVIRFYQTYRWNYCTFYLPEIRCVERHSTRCCDDDGQLRSNYAPNCFPIVLPEDDPVFSKYKRMCMNFVRSTTDIDTGCNPGNQPAEQVRDLIL